METIIAAENVKFEYKNDETGKSTEVLKGVSLNIKKGEFVAILGHNGSGKSTLAKHFNAILTPTCGKVTVCGIDTSDESKLMDIRRRVGMVFQNPDNQMVANIVEDDVAFAPENLGIPQKEIRERVDEALAAVNMSSFAQHAPHMLSGGQKQRVAIAGVLAMRPEVIILDEPTAMLDPNGRNEVISTIKELNRTAKMTVILITHYMDEAVRADRVVVMDGGLNVMDGKPDEIFSQVEKLHSLGLDTPQATELAYLLKKRGFDIESMPLTAEDCVSGILRLHKKGEVV